MVQQEIKYSSRRPSYDYQILLFDGWYTMYSMNPQMKIVCLTAHLPFVEELIGIVLLFYSLQAF